MVEPVMAPSPIRTPVPEPYWIVLASISTSIVGTSIGEFTNWLEATSNLA
jgi:hypothetical protein